MTVQPIPRGYHTITPFLTVTDADAIVEFLRAAFDARELCPTVRGPDGRITHAELQIGDSPLMLTEGREGWPAAPSALYLYVPDVDTLYRRAMTAGATSISEPKDQFYGDRSAGVKDKSGNYWFISTHIEDVAPDELARRAAEHHGHH